MISDVSTFARTSEATGRSLDVTEQCDPSKSPVTWVVVGLEVYRPHIFLVSPLWFPVYRTLIQAGVFPRRSVYGVYVDDWHLLVQDLRFTLN